MAVYNNELWVGGLFTYADGFGIPVSYLAKWDGTQWYNVGLIPNGPVTDLAVLGNDLYISGGFKIMNGDTVNHIIKFNYITGFESDAVEIQNFDIYPNPTSGKFTFNSYSTSDKNGKLELSDKFGKLLFSEIIPPGVSDYEFQLPVTIANGVYICRFVFENETIHSKLVLER